MIVCLLTQFVIAVHPSFVNHFAYADVSSGSARGEHATQDLDVAASERPAEVLAAHRVPKQFAASAILVLVWAGYVRTAETVASSPRADTAPVFLAAASRGTFLRHRSLLI